MTKVLMVVLVIALMNDEHQLHIDLRLPGVPHPTKAGPVNVIRPSFAPRTYSEEAE